ncbi:hypothetical protein UFOVP1346_15 [uncultured Caudovirales phage]|uniref:Uncharacterized protein n=1 Tax=uncultured Caudovirales phage TaxID=2100421 RepID=A0A6J5PS98_9CAUD|nr:hypothetical protein UFOVP921_55 [uncultured Caudovirales phage]CAB4187536.1 hypothetical protein UFOVP1156_31 [uncultured Caudovirales phage]CAB4199954.1 hypothetical protein UFOVP1346_15 [uncultured Caudovirales phage]
MSIYTLPSATFQAVLTGASTGLTGTLGVRVLNLAVSPPTTVITRTTSGIVENPSGSGVYIASLTAPSLNGEYLVVWDTGSTTPATTATEELFVTGTPPSPVTTATGEQFSLSLSDLRTEVLNHGFDGSIYTPTRLNQYLNDALGEISAKAQYYGEEQESAITLTPNVAHYAFPSRMSRLRSVRITEPLGELSLIDLRDIDRSNIVTGLPYTYAIDGSTVNSVGSGITLYPTPDQAYPMRIRYWALMSPMTGDDQVSGLPARYQRSLATYAIARCFEAEDDVQQAQYYDAKWLQAIKDLKADLVFPLTDGPRQVKSMWDSGPVKPGWGFWP